MKINIYIAGLTAALLAALSSCSMLGPLDDIEIDYVYTDQTVITDATSAENLLAGLYTSWKSFGNSTFFSNMALRAGTVMSSNIAGYQQFSTNQITETNSSVEQFYTGQYYITNGANSLIAALKAADQVPGLSSERRAEILSEAYFLRALSKYYLLCTFGEFYDMSSEYGIVIQDEPVRENLAKPRSTVAQCYESILDDLTLAENAPVSPQTGHASLYAVQMLRAKAELYSGDYDAAAATADKLITAKGTDLAATFAEPFASPYTSPEVLFCLYCTYPDSPQSNANNYAYYYTAPGAVLTALADELDGVPGDGTTSSASEEDILAWLAEGTNEADVIAFYNEMMEGWTNHTSFQDLVNEFIGYGLSDDEALVYALDTVVQCAEFMGSPINGSAWAGYDSRYLAMYDHPQGSSGMGKYVYPTYTTGPSNTIFFLRLSDAWYVKAEAEARQGEGHYAAARLALSTVLARNGYEEWYVDMFADDELVATIMKHRYMENFTENMDDYYDQVRAFKWDGANFCENDTRISDSNTLIAPLPRAALAGNNRLTQLP